MPKLKGFQPRWEHGAPAAAKPAVVLDTNVFINAVFARHARRPERVTDRDRVANRVATDALRFFRVCFTDNTKEELSVVLFGGVGDRITNVFNRQNYFGWVMARAQMVRPGDLIRRCEADPDDDHIIQAATGSAAKYIVTSDHDLLDMERVGRILIISPPDLCRGGHDCGNAEPIASR